MHIFYPGYLSHFVRLLIENVRPFSQKFLLVRFADVVFIDSIAKVGESFSRCQLLPQA
jgi:hypothetical protein